MTPTQLSQRTREALDRLPPDKRARAETIIARSQTPEARAHDEFDRATLDREYRETGRISTIGEKVDPNDSAAFREFVETLRDERLAQGLSLEELALRSKLDKAALARFPLALLTAIRRGRCDHAFSPREKVPRRGG
jgi:hypothetical protein